MKAIYKRELASYFNSMTGYILSLIHICAEEWAPRRMERMVPISSTIPVNMVCHLSFQQKILPQGGDGDVAQDCGLAWHIHAQARHRTRRAFAAKELGGHIGLHPLYKPSLQSRPVQRGAALQEHAVDLLLPQTVHEGRQVHMAAALRQRPHPASGGLVGGLFRLIGAAGGQHRGHLRGGAHHLGPVSYTHLSDL